jgi:hypothetical protein
VASRSVFGYFGSAYDAPPCTGDLKTLATEYIRQNNVDRRTRRSSNHSAARGAVTNSTGGEGGGAEHRRERRPFVPTIPFNVWGASEGESYTRQESMNGLVAARCLVAFNQVSMHSYSVMCGSI